MPVVPSAPPHATRRTSGNQPTRVSIRRSYRRSTRRGLGFLRHIGTRLGVGPGTLYRQNARLWKYLCRDVGRLSAEVGSKETTVELVEFPARDHEFPCFVDGLDGCLRGLVAGLDVTPRVEVVALDLDVCNVRYHITW